uniref:RNA helicase n=1 Tax=Parastrongyloides trichosuri TaxID=131310 RepID=A0A0N4ZH83_PARTI
MSTKSSLSYPGSKKIINEKESEETMEVCGKKFKKSNALKVLNDIMNRQGRREVVISCKPEMGFDYVLFHCDATVQITTNGPIYKGSSKDEDRDVAYNLCAYNILIDIYNGSEKNLKLCNFGNATKKGEKNNHKSQLLISTSKTNGTFKILDIEVTVENAKSVLNQVLCKEGKTSAKFDIDVIPGVIPLTFKSFIEIKLESSGNRYTSEKIARSKRIASIDCAYDILRQMSENGEYVTLDKRKVLKIGLTKSTIEIFDDKDLYKDIEAFYKWIKVELPEIKLVEQEKMEKPQLISPPSFFTIQGKFSEISQNYDVYKNEENMKEWFPPISNYDCWKNCTLSSYSSYSDKSLYQISELLLFKENNKHLNYKVEETRKNLPVYKSRFDIINASENHQAVLIKSNTGSGKSTQVAQFLLKHYINNLKGAEFNCIITQPRRLSAISLAKRVAQERYEIIGESVGYCVRFDKVDPRPYGSIVFGTVGTVLKKLASGFRGISHIIVDEVHERSLDTDFLLIILKKLMNLYSNLKVILMSATVDTSQFERYIDGIRVIELEGTSFEVQELYLDEFIQHYQYFPSHFIKPDDFDTDKKKWSFDNIPENKISSLIATNIAEQIEQCEDFPFEIIIQMIRESAKHMFAVNDFGSILIFVPGWSEIATCIKQLEESENSDIYYTLPLHSNLSTEEQNRVFEIPPEGKIKVIISTNIAESSITVNDVLYIIDSCKQKMQMRHHDTAASVFRIGWASKDCMEQRKGRAGRVRPGYCYRLVTKKLWNLLQQQSEAEIKTAPLHSTILELKALGLGDSKNFLRDSMESIDDKNIYESEEYLQRLSALDESKNLTHIGKLMQRLPFSPDTSKCIITAALFNVLDSMSIISGNCSSPISLYNSDCDLNEISDFILGLCGDFISDHIIPLMAMSEILKNQEYQNIDSQILRFINESSIQYLMMVRNQIFSILKDEFKETAFYEYGIVNNKSSCAQMNVIISLLVKSYYPNIAFQNRKRLFLDMDGFKMSGHKSSVISLDKENFENRSPFIIYSQKVITTFAMFKECSVVSPLQILLFGSNHVVYKGGREVRLDDCFIFDIDPKFAQMVLHLKVIIDELLQILCARKLLNQKEQVIKHYVRNLVERISTMGYKINDRVFERRKLVDYTEVDFTEIGGNTNWV